MNRLLMVEDDEALARSWSRLLRKHVTVACVHTVNAALQVLREQPELDVIWSDHHLTKTGGGVEVLRMAAQTHPGAALLMVTGRPDDPALVSLPDGARVFDKARSVDAVAYVLEELGRASPCPRVATTSKEPGAHVIDREPRS